jgi:hypothetical protein
MNYDNRTNAKPGFKFAEWELKVSSQEIAV